MKLNIMPQEVEIWYVLPALRKEITKTLINDFKINQKEVAKILGVSEGAISQYLSSKRGGDFSFDNDDLKKIKKASKKILENPKEYQKELYNLCINFRKTKTICRLHKNADKSIPKNCNVCLR